MNVDAVRITPAVTAVAGGSPAATLEALGLQAGETVAVKVAAMTAEGIARLMVGGTALDVKTDRPLTPGATLNLTVQQEGAAVKLMLALPPSTPGTPATTQATGAPAPATAAGTTAPTNAPAATAAAVPPPSAALAPQANVAAAVVDLLARGLVPAATAQLGDGARVALATRAAQPGGPAIDGEGETSPAALKVAVTEGVRAAAGRQESLASLFADLGAASRGANARLLPQPVAKALAEVLGFRVHRRALRHRRAWRPP